MRCLKCGTNIPNSAVFCDSCLEDAKAYPVKPGTPIKLSFRDDPPAVSTAATPRRTLSPSEQNQLLRRAVRNLRVLVALLSVLLLGSAGMLLHLLFIG